MRIRLAAALVFVAMAIAPMSHAQESNSSSREATREKLRKLLDSASKLSEVRMTFEQASKEPFNFVGSMVDGMKNADSLEVVLRVSKHDTISVRVFPHYDGGYINLDKVKDSAGLMRQMLHFSDSNFLYWGADETNDAFAAYTFTLESGFPDKALETVLRSIRNTDQFVGQLRPFIDGTKAE